MPETPCRWFRGEGGTTIKLDVPLTPEMADQVRLGKLVEIPEPTDSPEGAPGPVAAREPAVTDAKSLWVDYAIAHGMTRAEATGMTRPDLIARFSSAPKGQ